MHYRFSFNTLFAAALLTVPIAFVPTFAHAQSDAASNSMSIAKTSGIVVGGTGTVYVVPDIARISAGVTTQDIDPKKAAQDNATLSDAVTKAVRAQGVAAEDIRTENYNVSPQYRYDQGNKPTLTGYEVTNSIRITIRKIGDAGRILDAAVKEGANAAGGIEFALDESTATKAKDQALALAVQDAARKAVVMAKAGNAGRIDLQSIVEGEPVVFVPRPVMFNARAASAAPATPVSAGQQTVTESVTLRYSINTAMKANY